MIYTTTQINLKIIMPNERGWTPECILYGSPALTEFSECSLVIGNAVETGHKCHEKVSMAHKMRRAVREHEEARQGRRSPALDLSMKQPSGDLLVYWCLGHTLGQQLAIT